jgi:transposase, IS5 family
MRGFAIARWRSWSNLPSAMARACGRVIAGSQNAPRSWSGVHPCHQFKRAGRELKFLRIRLGRVIRDIRRKIACNQRLQERFADLLALAVRVRFQDHRQRGPKVYALHAPRWSALAKAVRVQGIDRHQLPNPRAAGSCCTPKRCTATVRWPHAGPVISQLERQAGVTTRPSISIRVNRGHNDKEKCRVWISGQHAASASRSTARCSVEPVIGYVKAEHCMGRNHLKGRDGDRINAVLAPPATTSLFSCSGWQSFCLPSSRRLPQDRRVVGWSKNR